MKLKNNIIAVVAARGDQKVYLKKYKRIKW